MFFNLVHSLRKSWFWNSVIKLESPICLHYLPFDVLHIVINSNVKNSNGNACAWHNDIKIWKHCYSLKRLNQIP